MGECEVCGHEEGPRPNRVLVLSGGGGKGIYEAAWLEALLQKEPALDFDGFIGISAGSLNAAYLAGTPMAGGFGSQASRDALRQRVAALLALWESVRSCRGVYDGDLSKKYAVFFRVFVLGKAGAVDPAPIRAMIDQHIRSREISTSGRRLLVGATQLDTGRYVEFCEQCPRIHEGVKASTAIPAAFSPVWCQGRRYVDGAIINNTPLGSAYRMNPKGEILAVQTTPIRRVAGVMATLEADVPARDPDRDGNAFEILVRAARIMSEEVQKDDVEGAWRWHIALSALEAAGRNPFSNRQAIQTRVWAPKDRLIEDEEIFEWDDLCRMRDQGRADAQNDAFLDFVRDSP